MAGTVIQGAGASFPYPLYAWWALRYEKESGTKINYQSIGSGGGIKSILDGSVDFGASDAPMSSSELEKHGLIQFATVLGGVVPIINVPGVPVGEMHLSGPLLAQLFMGKISHWDDMAIKKLNPKLTLPHLPVHVLYRAGSSGTTWIFTNYLSKVHSPFKKDIGNSKKVAWPVGVAIDGSDGMVKAITKTPGAIGYAEYAYAVQGNINYALLQNRDGEFVHPNQQSFQAAAASIDWSNKEADVVLTDQVGKETWPITGATFILMYKDQSNPEKAQALLNFFKWCYHEGDQFAEFLDYVPVPEVLVKNIYNDWTNVRSNEKNVPVEGK